MLVHLESPKASASSRVRRSTHRLASASHATTIAGRKQKKKVLDWRKRSCDLEQQEHNRGTDRPTQVFCCVNGVSASWPCSTSLFGGTNTNGSGSSILMIVLS
jgi:hypothetical protein